MKSAAMDKPLCFTAIAVAAVLALTACSKTTKPTATETKAATEAKKELAKPSGPIAAQTAFYEMYKPARTWSADVMPLSLASGEVSSLKNEGGKAAVWTTVFVSPSRHEARTLYYSVVDEGESISKGVTAGGTQPWSGPTPKSRPFQTSQFLVNSDAAYATAFAQAAAWVKRHPEKKASLFLGSTARFVAPVWLVIWGTPKSGYAVYVDATPGVANPKYIHSLPRTKRGVSQAKDGRLRTASA